jgi:glutathione S-transferase
MILERDEPWFDRRLAALESAIAVRLRDLSTRLGNAEWLDGAFSAGDLMMASVLRRLGASSLGGSHLLGDYPDLAAYLERCESRPAFRRAFAAQLAVFNAASDGR